MRRIIRLTIFLLVAVGAVWVWRIDRQFLVRVKDRTFAEAVLIYKKIIGRYGNFEQLKKVVGTKDRLIIWCGSQCFWLGRDGVIFAEAPGTEGSLIKTAKTSSVKEWKTGDQVLSNTEAENLYAIADLLERFEFNFSRMDLGDLSLKEVEITLASGLRFYFGLKIPPDFAIPVIESLIKSGEINSLEYIDFRMENRAYYR